MAVVQFGNEDESVVSKPARRMRWATQRRPGIHGSKKRTSIIDKLHQRKTSKDGKLESNTSSLPNGSAPSKGSDDAESRLIYVNLQPPPHARDENGNSKVDFGRNKIRTAKYTPLSFLPKNMWYQFHSFANIYFLFIILLSIGRVFGATNPGLGAVPLICILTVTAIKDGVEDWRRTVLDNDLNNSPIHRLVDWKNVNYTEDQVSTWRRIKKATARATKRAGKWFKRTRNGEKAGPKEEAPDTPRASIATQRPDIRTSSHSYRPSFQGVKSIEDEEAIQMTPLPYPAGLNGHSDSGELEPRSRPRPTSNLPPAKFYGSLVNHSAQTPGKARFKRDYWKNVQVGDFIRIYNGAQIPADVVILSTSDPDGACYVETKNLDGETNLKVRQALHCGRAVKHARDCEGAEFVIESEPPHPNLYQYTGAMKWTQSDPNFPEPVPEPAEKEMVEAITINNVLLRGCNLRNTEWVLAVVIFTGLQTKIMLNTGSSPRKTPRLAKDLSWNIMYNFAILFAICLTSGIVQGVIWAQGNNSLDYFEFGSYGGKPAVDGIITFWVALILYQNLVPISLFVSLEIIHMAQAVLIHSDTFMYYEKLEYPCTPKSWNISDDLGQIEYIFSDKTGTLTQNIMEFKKCTVNGVAYGEAYTEAQAGMQRREGINVEEVGKKAKEDISHAREKMLKQLRDIHDNPYLHDDELTFVAPQYVSDLMGASGEEQKKATEDFMIALALCHTVITERTPGDPPRIDFKAQSPDEAALVATARDCGFTVLGRAGDDIRLNIMGEERRYTVLNTLEFNSTRKRMSTIVRMPDGKITLFCKGADSIIYSRLSRGKQPELRKSTAAQLEVFAREGLRTLCVGLRTLSEEEYQTWAKIYEEAAQAMIDRDNKLEEAASAIEQNLTLIGGTAIEDRLQDGVPDTISLLGAAGIKLWVLTGDKVETAINIGFSCNLLTPDMELIVFNIDNEDIDAATIELDRNLAAFNLTGSDEELIAAQSNHEPPSPTHALVIDGEMLKLMISDQLKQKFLLLCKQCRSVICCRVSPAQKAAVVKMVKDGLKVMALSVGDGANDVAMIQEADIGIGIAGEEGRQAVMSSDYAIGQFRYLQRLILVHGRWSYRRIAEMLSNFFYKNLVWIFSLFWYSIYNNFDGSYLFESTYIILVNLAFTSLPVIIMGILDQDVDDKVSLAVPQLYKRGIEQKDWSRKKFWLYMLDGFYQSVICFFMTYLTFRPAQSVTENGLDLADRTRMGIFVACYAVISSNTYVLLNTYRWDWFTVLISLVSTLLIFFWTGVYSATTSSGQFYQAGAEVFGNITFWALLLLTVVACLGPRFTFKSIQKIYFPRDVDIVREQVVRGDFKYLEKYEAYVPLPHSMNAIAPSGDKSAAQPAPKRDPNQPDDERPIYPPSVAATATTHSPRSQNGSDTTAYTSSLELRPPPPIQPPDRVRPSFERCRSSVGRVRSSFEASRDFTSAAMLARIESSHARDQSGHPEH
ncbi:phospholipid transporting ATPase [Microsporum audouinii]